MTAAEFGRFLGRTSHRQSSTQWQPGQIVVTSAGVVQVNVAGGYPAARWLKPYVPVHGDAVMVMMQGMTALVIGKIGGVTTAAPPPPQLPETDPAYIPPPTPPPPPDQQSGQTTFPAIQCGSYSNGIWQPRHDNVVQGAMPPFLPAHSGAFFYGTTTDQLLGAVIQTAEIWVRIRSVTTDPATVHFYRHTSRTRPTSGDVTRVQGPSNSAGWSAGQSGWVTITTAWAQSIVDGGGGIGVLGDPYTKLAGLSRDGQAGALRLSWVR